MVLSSLIEKFARRRAPSGLGTMDRSGDVKHLQKVFDHCSRAARIGVWECTLADEKLYWTDMVYEIFDLPPNTPLVRDEIVALYSPEAMSELHRLRTNAIEQRGGFSLDAEIVTRKGNRRWVRITASVECENGAPVRIFGLKQDVTAEMIMLREIRRRAEFDHLTGLHNRFKFHERLDQLSDLGSETALLLVDLDGFKNVNDTLGHKQGDLCLIDAAARLSSAAEGADLVARIGGDEFAVIYSGSAAKHIEQIAGRMVSALSWQLGEGVSIGASIGVAHSVPGTTSGALYEEADKAMYEAKTQGRNRFVLLHPQANTLSAA